LSGEPATARVAVVHCPDYDHGRVAAAVARQFELLGGVERFVKPGQSVLIKPNFIAPRSHRHATQTHPAVIIAIARLIQQAGGRVCVGDSPAWSNVRTCARALRLDGPLREMGVPLIQLDKPRIVRVDEHGTRVGISAAALDADVIINVPKFKAHQQMVATFAVKNMFGVVSGKWKAVWHLRRGGDVEAFSRLLIDIYRRLAPAVTIIDGIVAMEGSGPIRGHNKPLGWLIGSTDPIAAERVCSEMVNLDPSEVPIIRTAAEMGFGAAGPDAIETVGDSYKDAVCTDFLWPKSIPLRFGPWHVCKSIARQAVILIQARRDRKAKGTGCNSRPY